MPLDSTSQFRITLWPGVPLPIPVFTRRTEYRLDATRTALVGCGVAIPVTQRHGETYLRLYELDLNDADAILAFTRVYGPISTVLLDSQLRLQHFTDHRRDGADRRAIESVIQQDPEVRRRLDPSAADFDPLEITPLAAFTYAARCLRDLTTAWRILNRDRTLTQERRRWELGDGGKATKEDAFQLLTNGLTPLLARFAPFVHGAPPSEEELDVMAEGGTIPNPPALFKTILNQVRGLPNPLLHEICALELHNHIAGREVYRNCQNENCGKAFVHQYGRAEQGQSRRQGVLYCSASCAQARAQRQYRRRKSRTQSP